MHHGMRVLESNAKLVVTHLVMTFYVGDNHVILRINLACGTKPQNEHAFLLCLVCQVKQREKIGSLCFLEPLREHRISSPMAIVMITDTKCSDQVTDQELVAQNVTKHVMVASTV